IGSRRTTPTAPLCAAVVSDATEAPTNTPWLQSKACSTSGAVRARRPPNTTAEMGTPCGSSNLGEIDGHCAAGAVKREFGWAAFHRPELPALLRRRRDEHGEVRLAARAGKGGGDVMRLALGALHADDQHVLGEPALFARLHARDAEREALLAEERVAAVAGAD